MLSLRLLSGCRQSSYAGELSPEERGLLRSQELTEMRDHQAAAPKELSPEERGLLRSQDLTQMRDRQAAAQPPPQTPPSPQQPLRASTATSAGLWPEGFTQVRISSVTP